jgi:hypothetical protein
MYQRQMPNKNDGEECSDYSECNFGKGCIAVEVKSKCLDLIQQGYPGCITDWVCERTAGCNVGQCVNYFSLPDGSELK